MYVFIELFEYLYLFISLAIVGDSESNSPLLKSNGPAPVTSDPEDEKKQKSVAENSQESTQDKTDTVTDLKEELCDLSVFKSA